MKIGYARVSTPDQKLDMQIDALLKAGCEPVFSDRGVSGVCAERPGLDQALATVGRGDILVVWKLDRLGRSVLHLADLLNRFHDSGVEFRSLSEGIDTTTMSGKLVYHIFSAMGEFERELIRERTINGMRAAKARGKHLGRPALLTYDEILSAFFDAQEGTPLSRVARERSVSYSTLKRSFIRFGFVV